MWLCGNGMYYEHKHTESTTLPLELTMGPGMTSYTCIIELMIPMIFIFGISRY